MENRDGKMEDIHINYDPAAKAAYIKVREGRVHKTVEEVPGVFLDIGTNGQLLGVEFLDPKKIDISLVRKIAKEFKTPSLKHVNPNAIPKVYLAA